MIAKSLKPYSERQQMNIFVSGSLAFDRIMSFPGRFADHILKERADLAIVLATSRSRRQLIQRMGRVFAERRAVMARAIDAAGCPATRRRW